MTQNGPKGPKLPQIPEILEGGPKPLLWVFVGKAQFPKNGEIGGKWGIFTPFGGSGGVPGGPPHKRAGGLGKSVEPGAGG